MKGVYETLEFGSPEAIRTPNFRKLMKKIGEYKFIHWIR